MAYDQVKSKPVFFIFNALPFGATGSVYSFNRVAKSLWHAMVSLGGVWTTQYYDDFPNIELRSLADNSRAFMEFILDALGWRFASEGKKAEPPLPCFRVLGVLMDMSHSSTGKLVVSNKPERVEDLVHVGQRVFVGFGGGVFACSVELCTGTILWLHPKTWHGVSSKVASQRVAFGISTGACNSGLLHCGESWHSLMELMSRTWKEHSARRVWLS